MAKTERCTRSLRALLRLIVYLPVVVVVMVAGCVSNTVIQKPASPSSTINSVTVSCTPSAILTTQTSACTAVVQGTGAFNTAYTWGVQGGAITPSGVFTPAGAGKPTITATSIQDTSKFGTATVTAVTSPVIDSVAVTCTPASVLVGHSSQCSAIVQGVGTLSSAVTWSATGGTITSSGLFTPTTAGTATITATSTQDTTKSGSTVVTATVPVAITSVSVVCAPASILTTQTSACSANVQGTGAYSSAVIWSATGGTITAVGVFTPTAAGTATIIATSTQDATKSGSATVTATVPVAITSVSVACAPASILTSQTSACTPTVSGTGSYSSAITWSVSPANMGTVSSAGVFSPAGAGTAIIQATSTQDATKYGVATVTVTVPAKITSVAVVCTPASILTTQTSVCTPTVTGMGSYSPSVQWTVAPAGIGTVDSSGVFTPAAAGTATVTATSTQDSTQSGSAAVVVADPTALTITISDLPSGTLANVTVTDPNGQQTKMAASQTMNATAGAYTITAGPVIVGTSTYRATQTMQTVNVASGGTSTVVVDYYNIVPNSTKVLDKTGAQSLVVSPDGSTLTIDSASEVAQSLRPGDVLVSGPTTGAPNGLLVKVTAVTSSGSSIIVTATTATLFDEVTQAHFGVDLPFVLPSGLPAYSTLGEVSVPSSGIANPESTSLANPCAAAASKFAIPISSQLPLDASQNTIAASGEVDFCNLHVDFDINPLKPILLTISLQQYSDMVIHGRYSTAFDFSQALDLEDLKSKVVCLGNETCEAVNSVGDNIGAALQVVTGSVTPFIGITGSAGGGLYFGGAESGDFQTGVKIDGISVTPIHNNTLQQVAYPAAVDGALDVKAFVGLTLELKLLGSFSVHVDPRAFAEFKADTGANPWWTLSLGDEGEAGGVLSLGGLFSTPFDTKEYTIVSFKAAQAKGPFSALPTLQDMNPNTAAQNASSLTLYFDGENFVPGCYVIFNGVALKTAYIDPTLLTAILPSSLLAATGSYQVEIRNSDSTGATSNTLPFIVTALPMNPVPAIHGFFPALLTVGAVPQTLTVSGSGFISSSAVTYNNVTHKPTLVDGNHLTIWLTAGDLANIGSYPVVVTNPKPGGGASAAAYFTVYGKGSSVIWPVPGHDPQKTGLSDFAGPHTQPSAPKWTLTTNKPIVGDIVVAANGTLYFASDQLYAVDADGYTLASAALSGNAVTGPLVDDAHGYVYIGVTSAGGSHDLVRYDKSLTSGTIIKHVSGNSGYSTSMSSLTLGLDGTVYFISGYRPAYIYAVGPSTWSLVADGYGPCSGAGASLNGINSPAIGADGAVYIMCGTYDANGYYSGLLRKLDPGTGNLLVSADSGASSNEPIIDKDGNVHVADLYGDGYGNPVGDNTVWGSSLTVLYSEHGYGAISRATLFPDGTSSVYSVRNSRNYVGLTAEGAKLSWNAWTDGETTPFFSSLPSVDAFGMVFIGNDKGVQCLAEADGSTIWSYTTGDKITTQPAISNNGDIYVGSSSGTVYAFAP